MIDEDIKNKVKLIINLVMLINDSPTEREETSDKPTVFFGFSGNVAMFEIRIHSEGWANYAPFNEWDKSWRVYLSDSKSETDKHLNDAIRTLTELAEKWGA